MAERTAFDSVAGIGQCRVEPSEMSPLHGDFVFVMGSEIYQEVDVAIGDKIELQFTHDFTASPWGFFGIYFRISKHESTSPTVWKLTVLMQAVVHWTTLIYYERDHGWFPVRIATGKAAGNRTIKVTLERA